MDIGKANMNDSGSRIITLFLSHNTDDFDT